jgi:predicted small secreted protein
MEHVKRLFVSLAVMASVFGTAAGLAGCNTVEGVGEDVEAGGEAIQDAADHDDDE